MTDRPDTVTTHPTPDDAIIDGLRTRLRGPLLQPDHAEYERARRVWNGMIDRRPAAIARCSGVADVMTAVEFARTHSLRVAVRGGGHNVAGHAVCDGGLVIDLSQLRGVRVDAAQRTARAAAGCTWGDFDRETQALGLATTGGEVSSTGIAGLTLGGGLGWLMGRCGLACDNLLSADVVTADGRLLVASAGEHADLFWGLRGGGGNFGIVTSFEYRLHPIATVLAGLILYPMSRARDVLRAYRDCTAVAPDELTIMGALLATPDGTPAVGAIVCHCGVLDEGKRLIAPLRRLGAPLVDTIAPTPYVALQSMLDPSAPAGRRNYWKASFVRDLSDAAIDALIAPAAGMPSPYSSVLIEHLHGAVTRVAPAATAFGVRTDHYSIGIFSVWEDAADSAAHIRWARDTASGMEPFSDGGAYVNYLGEDGQMQVRAAYGANYDRLAALKNIYDPTNFFRLNQNIPPSF